MNIAVAHNENKSTAAQSATRMKEAGKNLHNTPEYSANPHQSIIDFVTPFLDSIKIGPAKVLVATYRQPKVTAGGLMKTEKYIEEDKFQGAAGLVLKIGAAAFKDDATTSFAGFKAEPLDWITYRPVHGSAREIAGLHCRFLQDIHIDAVIKDPTLVW